MSENIKVPYLEESLSIQDDNLMKELNEQAVEKRYEEPVIFSEPQYPEPEIEVAGVSKVEEADSFLAQIDEFRARAKQLQEVLQTRETKAQQLQAIVDENEGKVEQLQQVLDDRKKVAEEVTNLVSSKIDELNVQIVTSIQRIDSSLHEKLGSIQGENEGIITQLKTEISQLSEQMITMNDELSRKIHLDNVQGYRNTQEVLKVLEEKVECIDVVDKKVKSVRRSTKFLVFISWLNLFGIIAIILDRFGIIDMILELI